MKIIETTFEKLPTKCLLIGFEGENLRATVRIDCASVFAEYSNATPTLIVKPLFADAYPVVVDRNGTCVDWVITSEILSFSGDGEIQLVFYKDQVICKSAVSKIRVCRSLQVTGDMPDPVAQWIDDANAKLAEVDAAIVSIDEMDAVASGLPEGTDPTVEVSMVDDHKRLSFGIPKGDTGEKGDKGDKGDRGEVGATPQMGIGQVSTLPAGSSATASMSGTPENPLLNLGIPQGIQGVKGDRGEKGETGATGATGATPDFSIGTVSTLPAGSSATAEITGTAENPVLSLGIPQGVQGIQGEKGDKGDPGEGVPVGGLKGQVLAKASDTDRDTEWIHVAPVIKNEASGAIASFTDGADGHPIDELKVSIKPVQDLHGYDHPWPAGGGKNLLDINNIVVGNTTNWSVDVNGDTLTVTHKTGYTTGTPTFAFNQPSGTYVVSIGSINITGQVSLYVNGSWAKTINNGDTFTIDAANTNEIKFSAQENQATIITKIQIESGSTATSYTPFSNICPITGWDGVQVWDDPEHGGNIEWNQLANVSDGDTTDSGVTIRAVGGKITASGTATSLVNHLISSTAATSGHKFLITNIDSSASFPTYYILFGGNIGIYGEPKIVTGNGSTNGLRLIVTGGQSINAEFTLQCFDLTEMFGEGNEPSTVEEFKALFPADYYPYNAGEITTVSAVNGDPYRHYSITLPTEAGTVYGGTLDVSTGELVVDRKSVVYDGSNDETWEGLANLPWRYGITANDIKLGNAVSFYVTSNLMKTTAEHWSSANYGILNNMNSIVVGYPPASNDVAAFRAFLSSNPLQVVYLLATPITYTLTPTEIRTLLGQNNIWSDAGDVSVKYNADTKLYIDGKIAELVAQIVNS